MESNQKYINEIKVLLKEHNNQIIQVIQQDRYQHLKNYIDEWCSFMVGTGQKFKFRTKVWYVINAINDFVRCKNPNCQKKLIKDIVSYDNPHLMYCNTECKKTDPLLNLHFSKVAKSFSDEKIALKNKRREQTCMMKYGQKFFRNDAKREQTLQKRYGEGITNPFQAEEVKQKIRQTNIDRYGMPSYTQCDEFIWKMEQSNMANYGVPYYSQTEESKQRIKQTCQEKYGSPNPLGNEEVKAKSRKTCQERYGCDTPSQNKDIAAKQRTKYIMHTSQVWKEKDEVIMFHSIPEIAFYIWCIDNGKEVTYQPDVSFDYDFGGKTHFYFPDFEVNGQLIEIKGDHFFNESGQMICPFKDISWTDAQFQEQCNLYEAKHQCMLKNNVKIIRSDEYKVYLKYVDDKYGKDFLRNFKRSK